MLSTLRLPHFRSTRLPVFFLVALLVTASLFYYVSYHAEAVGVPFHHIWPSSHDEPQLPPSSQTDSQPPPSPDLDLPLPPACPINPAERLEDPTIAQLPLEPHPIDELIQRANEEFEALLSREVHDLQGAAAVYRSRRGRNPPPLFDQWVQWAQEHDVILIEELFDQIYNDLEPFWALPPTWIREAAASYEMVISFRNGNITKEDERYRMSLWHDMLMPLNGLVPDVDLAFNNMDEPRVLVPYETVSKYMAVASDQGRPPRYDEVISNYARLPNYTQPEPVAEWIRDGDYWVLARDSCPPSSPAREAESIFGVLTSPPAFPSGWPNGSHEGYVSNWTFAKDPCSHPHLRGLHGTFIEPISTSTSKEFFPILGGSKLPMNNDILVPAPRYWVDDPMFSGGTERCVDWDAKRDAIVWRGVASGGRNHEENWRRFQRHRFISMVNSSHVQDALLQQSEYDDFNSAENELGPRPAIFPLPDRSHPYDVAAMTNFNFSTWIESFAAGAGFVDLQCFPPPAKGEVPNCTYTDPFYKLEAQMKMPTMFEYKYLPDIDGNSFSGRYRAFLRSHSLPIKATIYSEWHDSRLIAWKHFVPMDNTFVDFYGIMDYFLGYEGADGRGSRRGRDDVARKIALEGSDWAEHVLRREDMVAYMYRLILEYARIVDERRDLMGFTGDQPNDR